MNIALWIGGIVIGAVVAFFGGWRMRSRVAATRRNDAEHQAQALLDGARQEAETIKRTAVVEGKEETLRLRQQLERENQEVRNAQLATERAFQEKKAAFNRG